MRTLVALLAILPLGLPLVAHRPSRELCTISVSPAPPMRPEETYILATALPETVQVGPGRIHLRGEPGHVGYSHASSIYGQLFQLDGIGGDLSHGSDSAFLTRQSRVVVVIWDYDAGCAPTAWGLSARFVSPGQQAFLLLERRPRSQWPHGLPIFDNQFAGQLVYPRNALTMAESLGVWEGTLTAKELFDLTEALPPLCLWLRDPVAASRQFEAAKTRYASLINRWPGDNSVRVYELYAAEARRGETRKFIRDACAA
jgi:hypothetical protein